MLVVHAAQSELESMRSLAGSATEDPAWNDDDDLENVDDLPPTPSASSSSPLASAVPAKHAKPSSGRTVAQALKIMEAKEAARAKARAAGHQQPCWTPAAATGKRSRVSEAHENEDDWREHHIEQRHGAANKKCNHEDEHGQIVPPSRSEEHNCSNCGLLKCGHICLAPGPGKKDTAWSQVQMEATSAATNDEYSLRSSLHRPSGGMNAPPKRAAILRDLVRKRKTSLEPFDRFDDPDGILAEDALNDGTQAPPLAPSLAPLKNLDSASVPELVDLLLGSDRQAGKTDSTNKICALLITHPDVQNHPEALRHCKFRDGETAHVKYSKCVC